LTSSRNSTDFGSILALDWGTVRIGVALSDGGRSLASPYDTFPAKPKQLLFQKIKKVVKTEEVSRIIVGLPINMDGSEGGSAKKAREFAAEVEAETCLDVICIDERLSSFEAEQTLISIGRKPSRDKGRVDRVAATLILQEYLDSLKHAQNDD
jgi:putative holliday junction resolvase